MSNSTTPRTRMTRTRCRGIDHLGIDRLWLAELVLEAFEDVDLRRVDPALCGDVQRQQVAEHDGPQQPLGPGLAVGLDPDDRRRMGLDQLRGQVEALADPWMLVAVGEEGGAEAPLADALPADDLVVVGFRKLV